MPHPPKRSDRSPRNLNTQHHTNRTPAHRQPAQPRQRRLKSTSPQAIRQQAQLHTKPAQGQSKSGQTLQKQNSNRPQPKRKTKWQLRFPWQKKPKAWFQTAHPAQKRNLPKSNWFPHAPEPEAPPKPEKTPFKFELRYRPWMSSVSSVMLVLGIGTAITGCGWLSMQYLMNPKSVIWVNSYLPKPLRIKIAGWDQPYTLGEIRGQLQTSGLRMGDQIRLSVGKKSDLLIPILQNTADCNASSSCGKVVELRVYRPTQHPYKKSKSAYFQMLDQVPVSGMEDWFVQEPFVNAQVDVPPPSDQLLRFNGVEKLERRAPKGGTWLTLKGEQPQLGMYGQVFLYNPKRASLVAMVPWTSPNRELPRWQNITSGGTSELVVDQTIGLETLYQVYSLQPDSRNSSGLNLKSIELKQPASKGRRYADALRFARSGLWSLALSQLQSLEKSTFSKNPMASMQRDVIAFHAKRFKAQAERNSASTSQKVQANLLDGRWAKAIDVVKAVPGKREDVIELLNADAGQLLRRLKTATTITPGNSALQAWNAAMKLARSGQADTIAWLKQQPTNTVRNRFLSEIAPTLQPSPKPSPSPTSSPTPTPTARPNQPKPEKIPSWWKVIPVNQEQVITPPPEPRITPTPSPNPTTVPKQNTADNDAGIDRSTTPIEIKSSNDLSDNARLGLPRSGDNPVNQ